MSKPKLESNEENQNPNVFFDKENLIKRKKKQKKLLIIVTNPILHCDTHD